MGISAKYCRAAVVGLLLGACATLPQPRIETDGFELEALGVAGVVLPFSGALPAHAPGAEGPDTRLDPAARQQALATQQRHAAESVSMSITARWTLIQQFYAAALARSPRLRGDVVVRLTVAADGTVEEARVTDSTTGHPAFDEDLADLLGGWRLHSLPGVDWVRGHYLFRFELID